MPCGGRPSRVVASSMNISSAGKIPAGLRVSQAMPSTLSQIEVKCFQAPLVGCNTELTSTKAPVMLLTRLPVTCPSTTLYQYEATPQFIGLNICQKPFPMCADAQAPPLVRTWNVEKSWPPGSTA